MTKLFKPGSIVIVLGPGGVGKTTIAAALGLATARTGLPTAVLTVDPARRLRDALGLARLDGRLRQLDARRLRAAGFDPQTQFSAGTLDVKATWDGMVERLVPTVEARRQIFENSFYRNLTQHFAGAESYAALEQLRVMHDAGRSVIEVIDTPPATHAFDFIEAPEHLGRLLDSRSARWLFNWTNSAMANPAAIGGRMARMIVAQLEEFAGARPVSTIAEFFGAAAEAIEAIRARMLEATALLHSPAVSFLLVTTPEHDRLREVDAIARRLKAEKLRLAAVVINRIADERTLQALVDQPGCLPVHLREIRDLGAISASDRIRSVTRFLEDYGAAQGDSIIRAARFARELPSRVEVIAVPGLSGSISDLRGLATMADWLTTARTDRRFLRQAAETFRQRPGT